MRGHIRKRGSAWAYVLDIGRDESGRRRQQWRGGFATRRAAQDALTEALQRLQSGSYVEPSKQTLAHFLEEWLQSIRPSVRASTFAFYQRLARVNIAPALGTTPLQRLTTAQLNGLYAELLANGRQDGHGGLSPQSVRYVHATIRKALAEAVRWGRLARNVADQASAPRPRRRTAPSTWTADELRAFLEHVSGDRLYALYHLAATTGMRRSELLGLRWRDLDLDGGRLSVSQTVVSVDYSVSFSTPKTGHGRRSVALDSATSLALRQHRKRQLEERLALGGYAEDHDLAFCDLDGRPLHPSQQSKRFDRLVRSSGLPRLRFHDLRHTHATLALQAGVHPKVVSERLGHADIGTTLNTYSHAIPAMQEEAAERIAALLFANR